MQRWARERRYAWVEEINTQMQNWEQNQPADDPQIVVGGIDLIALAPFATT